MNKQKIESGDTVFHSGTKENWFVIGVDYGKNQLCVAGWPPTIGKISDCKLLKKGQGIGESEIRHRDKNFGGGWQ